MANIKAPVNNSQRQRAQAVFSPGPFRVSARYCMRIGRYPLVLVDPGSILWRALFFLLLLLLLFFPPPFFFSLSLFQLDGSIPTRSQFYSYHSFSFFPSLALLFFSSSNFPLAFLLFFFLLFFSHSIPSSCFLFSSPFYCFSFSLSSLSSFLPPPCPNACPTPPTTPSMRA